MDEEVIQAAQYENDREQQLLPWLHLKVPYVRQRHCENEKVRNNLWNSGAKKVFIFGHAMAGRRYFPEFVCGDALEGGRKCLETSVSLL